MLNIEDILKRLLNLSKKAFKKKEVPVAALIVYNNSIIAACYNKKEIKKDITAHAEVLAIKKAAKKLKRWNLSDCVMYVTLKPCNMCTEIIKQSRIRTVYYLLDKLDYKQEYSKTECLLIENKKYKKTYQQLLSSFFKNKR